MLVCRCWSLWVLSTMALAAVGCKAIPIAARKLSEQPPAGSVSRVVVLWSEVVLKQDSLPIAQGFAGKVYLFGPDSSEPVTAPGKFSVYANGETKARDDGAEQKSSEPTCVWEVQESDLRSLLKKDVVGWSYSLWVPYGPPVGSERRVSVRLSFTPENGRQILSESSLVTLPAVDSVGLKRTRTAAVPRNKSNGAKSSIGLAYCPLDELP